MESCDLRPLCMCGPFLNGALEKFSNLRLGFYGIWGTLYVAPFWPGAWQNIRRRTAKFNMDESVAFESNNYIIG